MPVRRSTWRPWRNLLRNTDWRGAVVGTPGTPPRGVEVFEDPPLAANGITSRIVQLTNEAGMRRLDWRFSGTALTAGNVAISWLGLAERAARGAPGQWMTHSCFVRHLGPSTGVTPGLALQINEYDAAGQFQLLTLADIFPVIGPIAPQRFSVSARQSAARLRPILGLYYETGQTFDFALGLALPQLERADRMTAPQRRVV